jgi:hypothetical protein
MMLLPSVQVVPLNVGVGAAAPYVLTVGSALKEKALFPELFSSTNGRGNPIFGVPSQ